MLGFLVNRFTPSWLFCLKSQDHNQTISPMKILPIKIITQTSISNVTNLWNWWTPLRCHNVHYKHSGLCQHLKGKYCCLHVEDEWHICLFNWPLLKTWVVIATRSNRFISWGDAEKLLRLTWPIGTTVSLLSLVLVLMYDGRLLNTKITCAIWVVCLPS